MYLSSTDGTNNVNIGDNSPKRQENISSFSSSPQSPAFPALLVVDDNSNSDDSSSNLTHIPSTTILSAAHVPATSPMTPLTNGSSNDTPQQQQRRRTSSIAKLLGGQPLNNQQYEEINQQIIEDQTAQNAITNGDNSTDSAIQRSCNSITRTLLMNAERNMSTTNTPITTSQTILPSFPQDFEYLIRRELDIEHAPSTLFRNSSTPSVFQNLNNARNTPPTNSPSPLQTKLKRKRANPKQIIPTTTSATAPVTTNKPSNIAPFTLRDPFELDPPTTHSIPPVNSTTMSRHHQNDLFRFDGNFHHPSLQYRFPINTSPSNLPTLNYHRLNNKSLAYAQHHGHNDCVSTPSSCSSASLSSFNSCPYPPPVELALPTPVSPVLSHASSLSFLSHNAPGASARKAKLSNTRPDLFENPLQRLQSTSSNQSTGSSSSVGQSVPLKKRLLHAYKNERWSSSAL